MNKLISLFKKKQKKDKSKVIEYKLQKGETIHDVSKKFQVSVEDILNYNKLSLNPDLFFSSKIKIEIQQTPTITGEEEVEFDDDCPYNPQVANQRFKNDDNSIDISKNQQQEYGDEDFVQKLDKIEKFDIVYHTSQGNFPGLLTICPGQIWFDPDYYAYKKVEKIFKKLDKKNQKIYLTDFQVNIDINDLNDIDYRKDHPFEFLELILTDLKNVDNQLRGNSMFKITFKDNIKNVIFLSQHHSVTTIHYIMQKIHHHICKFKNPDQDYKVQSEAKYYEIINQNKQSSQQSHKQQSKSDSSLNEKSIKQDYVSQQIQLKAKERENIIEKQKKEEQMKIQQQQEEKNNNKEKSNDKSQGQPIKIYTSIVQEVIPISSDFQKNQQVEKNIQNTQEEKKEVENNHIYPELFDASDIFEKTHYQQMIDCLPPHLQLCSWVLVYSPNKHGYSYQEFLRRTGDIGEHVIVCEDTKSNIFGAYLTEGWREQQYFFGAGESFLFTFKKPNTGGGDGKSGSSHKKEIHIQPYYWSEFDTNFQHCDSTGIAIGVGEKYGLYIKWNFQEGSSAATSTYSNPESLTSKPDFSIYNLEVYSLVGNFNKEQHLAKKKKFPHLY